MARPQADRTGCMTEVIVDTDVVSFLFKNHPIGQLYGADLAGRAAGVSFMTVADVERWALQYRLGFPARPLAAPLYRAIHRRAIQPRPLLQVGRGDGRRAGLRTPDRDGRRLDRRHGVALRCSVGYTQRQRLSGRSGSQADLPWTIAWASVRLAALGRRRVHASHHVGRRPIIGISASRRPHERSFVSRSEEHT